MAVTAPVLSERLAAQLLENYRHAPRTEPCVCGGFLVSGPGDGNVLLTVRRHQATPYHRRWQIAHDLEVWGAAE